MNGWVVFVFGWLDCLGCRVVGYVYCCMWGVAEIDNWCLEVSVLRQYTYIYTFIPGRWAPSLTTTCPHWSPVRDIGSPQDLCPWDKKLRVLVGGGAPRTGGAVCPPLTPCAPSPCASKVRRKPEPFSLQGLGPPRTECVRGVASAGRAGPGEVLLITFGSGGPESV